MFKKLVIAATFLAASTNVAFADISYSAPYVGANIGLVDTTSSTSNYRGLLGTLSLGYGALMNQNFYLAGEFLFNGNLGSFTINGPSLKTTVGYGISIIPGIAINERTMGYLRIGVVRSKFTNGDTEITGGQIGLGMQTNLCQNWDLRGEYVYTGYGSSGTISSPKADLFSLGVVYKFE